VSTFDAKIETINYNKEAESIIFAASSVQAVITLCVIMKDLSSDIQKGSVNSILK